MGTTINYAQQRSAKIISEYNFSLYVISLKKNLRNVRELSLKWYIKIQPNNNGYWRLLKNVEKNKHDYIYPQQQSTNLNCFCMFAGQIDGFKEYNLNTSWFEQLLYIQRTKWFYCIRFTLLFLRIATFIGISL